MFYTVGLLLTNKERMIIRGARPEGNFYILDKQISEDTRLSWSARGLLVYLLGKPNHWQVSVPALVKETQGSTRPTGRDGVWSMLRELTEVGYCSRQQSRKPDGTLGDMRYIISEKATLTPHTPEPCTAEPGTAEPGTANPTLVSIDVLTRTDEEARTDKDIVGQAFEHAWAIYPNRPGKNKASSLKAWNARIKAGSTPDEMIDGIKAYAAYCQALKTETQYIKQPATFFGKDLHFLSNWAIPQPSSFSRGNTRAEQRANTMAGLTNPGGFHAANDDNVIDVTACTAR